VVLVASSLPAFQASREARPLPDPKVEWKRVEMPHFTLFSSAAKTRTLRIGESLERFREILGITTTGMDVNSPLPTLIYVFRNEIGYGPYKIGSDGRPSRNRIGYFVRTRDGNYVTVDASAGSDPLEVVYHEYMHYFLENNLPGLPVWINEGLAEYYSTFRLVGGTAEIGRPVEEHLAFFGSRSIIPLDRLFEVTHVSPEYTDPDLQPTFYAQSWAVTHMLMSGDVADGPAFSRFVSELGSGTATAAAVRETLGTSVAELENELRSYIRGRRFSYRRIGFTDAFEGDGMEVVPMERHEVLRALGDLLVHHPPIQADHARLHLREALRVNPKHGDSYVTLGILAQRLGQDEEALDSFRKATEVDPENPRVWSRLGRAMVRAYMEPRQGTPMIKGPTPEPLLEAREVLAKSLELDSDDPATLAAFGRTFVHDAVDVEEGVAALTRASESLPSRIDVLNDLLILLVTQGDRERVTLLVEERIRPRADERTLAWAWQTILSLDFEEAERLYRAGKPEEAEALLREAAARTDDPATRSRILSRIPSDKTTVSSMDGVLNEPLLQQYDLAISAANAGDLEQAIEILENVRTHATDPRMRDRAAADIEAMREDLRRRNLVNRINEATALFNQGRHEEAAAAIEEVLASDPPDTLRAHAERMLADLQPYLPRDENRRNF
jgi:tetratricopeptide (TPR) repeat protein